MYIISHSGSIEILKNFDDAHLNLFSYYCRDGKYIAEYTYQTWNITLGPFSEYNLTFKIDMEKRTNKLLEYEVKELIINSYAEYMV